MMAYKAVAGGIGFIIGILFLGIWEVKFWDTLAFGLMAAGTALVALRRRSPEMKMLHSLSMMIFFQYAGFCIPVDFTYQVFFGAVMTAVWFLAERRFEHTLSNQAGGCVFSAVLAIDMAVLLLDMLFSRDSLGNQLAASAVVILLAAVMAEWGRRYPVLRGSVAAVLFALTLTGWEIFNRTLGMDVGYDVVVWGYVLIVSIWDMVKKDRFCIPHTGHWYGCAGACPAGESGDSFFFPSSVCLPAGEILWQGGDGAGTVHQGQLSVFPGRRVSSGRRCDRKRRAPDGVDSGGIRSGICIGYPA